jgi:hypothetical protein
MDEFASLGSASHVVFEKRCGGSSLSQPLVVPNYAPINTRHPISALAN